MAPRKADRVSAASMAAARSSSSVASTGGTPVHRCIGIDYEHLIVRCQSCLSMFRCTGVPLFNCSSHCKGVIMRMLKIIAVVLGSAFALSCGLDSAVPETDVDQQSTLPLCEDRDGLPCSRKGLAGMCDNGTSEQGFCVCIQRAQ